MIFLFNWINVWCSLQLIAIQSCIKFTMECGCSGKMCCISILPIYYTISVSTICSRFEELYAKFKSGKLIKARNGNGCHPMRK